MLRQKQKQLQRPAATAQEIIRRYSNPSSSLPQDDAPVGSGSAQENINSFNDLLNDVQQSYPQKKIEAEKADKESGLKSRDQIEQDALRRILMNNTTNLNEYKRVLTKIKSPMSEENFKLPPDTQSYNYVELVRQANANARYQRNLFNTEF